MQYLLQSGITVPVVRLALGCKWDSTQANARMVPYLGKVAGSHDRITGDKDASIGRTLAHLARGIDGDPEHVKTIACNSMAVHERKPMNNGQMIEKVTRKFVGAELTKAEINHLVNTEIPGATGDHYPGDYAGVPDGKGSFIAAGSAQYGDLILERKGGRRNMTFVVLPTDKIVRKPSTSTARQSAQATPDELTKSLAAKLAAVSGSQVPQHKGKNGGSAV